MKAVIEFFNRHYVATLVIPPVVLVLVLALA